MGNIQKLLDEIHKKEFDKFFKETIPIIENKIHIDKNLKVIEEILYFLDMWVLVDKIEYKFDNLYDGGILPLLDYKKIIIIIHINTNIEKYKKLEIKPIEYKNKNQVRIELTKTISEYYAEYLKEMMK